MDDPISAPFQAQTSQPDQTLAGEYQYSYTHIEPLALVEKLPRSEAFSEAWMELMVIQAYVLVSNLLIAKQGDRGEKGSRDDVFNFLKQTILKTVAEADLWLKLKFFPALILALPQLLRPPTLDATDAEVLRGLETALQQQIAQSVPNSETDNLVLQQQSLQRVLKGAARARAFARSNLSAVLGKELPKAIFSHLFMQLKAMAPKGRPSSLDDYSKLFATIPLPEVAKTFQTDEFFAFMRVAGPNPVMIERMTAPDPRLPVTEEQYQAVMGETDSWQAAIEQGRVYLADYGILQGAVNGTFGAIPPAQKYAYAPLALFAVPAGDGTDRLLRPVAIQCGQNPDDYPVITPATGADAWLMAKTVVQIADMNFHEAVSHLARTHLLIEPFILATHRQLPATHALFKLLVPHFQGTLAINHAAHEYLVAPKGSVHRLLSSPIETSRTLAVIGLQARGFNADMLPRRLQDRGVNDPSRLPVYPYRDDGLLIWEAIRDWAAAYLGIYYPSDEAVQGDRALQNWAKELVAFDGGRLQDFGDAGDGQIKTLNYLIEAVTMVIFTASAQHAAVNFPQNGLMSFAPASPAAGYSPAKAIGPESTPQAWLDMLPPLDQAQQQLNLLYLLGSVYFTRLGYYAAEHFTDPKVAAPLQAFQSRLQDIEATIDQRNADRPVYHYLKPSRIPQSINI
jgi:arachidonate 15-lipoxygenase